MGLWIQSWSLSWRVVFVRGHRYHLFFLATGITSWWRSSVHGASSTWRSVFNASQWPNNIIYCLYIKSHCSFPRNFFLWLRADLAIRPQVSGRNGGCLRSCVRIRNVPRRSENGHFQTRCAAFLLVQVHRVSGVCLKADSNATTAGYFNDYPSLLLGGLIRCFYCTTTSRSPCCMVLYSLSLLFSLSRTFFSPGPLSHWAFVALCKCTFCALVLSLHLRI